METPKVTRDLLTTNVKEQSQTCPEPQSIVVFVERVSASRFYLPFCRSVGDFNGQRMGLQVSREQGSE